MTKHVLRLYTRRSLLATSALLILNACGAASVQQTASPLPTVVPTATLLATTLPAVVPAITNEPLATIPSEQPSETRYTDPMGVWSLSYRAELLHPEDLGNGVIIFISQDRSTFVAVDSFVATGDLYGNTGEDLRNRGYEVLTRIYGTAPAEMLPLEQLDAPWQTGVRFTTAKGSEGIGVYRQPGYEQGDFRTFGSLYGFKTARADQSLELIQATLATLQINAFQ